MSDPQAYSDRLLDAALRYAELGYRVFPCVPGKKTPLTAHGFKDASTDPEQIRAWWAEHPLANVAIATEGLLVLDVDGKDHEWLKASDMAETLECAPLARTPRDGRHWFHKQPPGRSWRNTVGTLAPKVDTRADGGYVLVAPSRTDDGAYAWVEGMELDRGPDGLPEPPGWLADALDAVGAGRPGEERGPASSLLPGAALEDGNPIPEGYRNVVLTSLAGSMRRVGMTGQAILAALLAENAGRCVPPLPDREVERIAGSVARYEPDQFATAAAEHHFEQLQGEEPDEEAAVDTADPGPTPERLLRVPGFIGEVMDYTLETAPYPDQSLAFSGALVLMGLLAGRKVRDTGNARTNVYVMALASSGRGKDAPRDTNQKILFKADLLHALGDTIGSAEGLEDYLQLTSPAALYQTDEIHAILKSIGRGKNDTTEMIEQRLLKLFSSANKIYPMRRLAGGKSCGVIVNPHLCLFGTAVPQQFFVSLTPDMIIKGLLSRFLLLEAGPRGRGQSPRDRPPPKRVIETASWWARYTPAGSGNLARTTSPKPKRVKASPEAEGVLVAYQEWADDAYTAAEERHDEVGMTLVTRAYEYACRLALIYACSVNYRAPVITGDAARWACELIDHQASRLSYLVKGRVADGEFDALCKKVLHTIGEWAKSNEGEARGGRMPYSILARRCNWENLDKVLAALVNQRRLAPHPGRGGKGSFSLQS